MMGVIALRMMRGLVIDCADCANSTILSMFTPGSTSLGSRRQDCRIWTVIYYGSVHAQSNIGSGIFSGASTWPSSKRTTRSVS